MDTERFYRGSEMSIGIELFRVISMLMIVVLHINLKGGLMGCFGTVDEKYTTLWFGECACFCCVDCFALISGYVMVGRKLKAERVLGLWLQVFSISAIVATIFLLFFSEGIELTKITDGYLPLTKSQYWYFTAYFGMLFFTPLLNGAAEKLDRKAYKKLIVIILFLFTILPVILRKDLFRHSNGMSSFWLCIMYLVGAYFGKYGIDTKKYSKIKSAIYALICATAITAWIVIHSYNVGVETGKVEGQWDYLYYTNPIVVAQAIFMLMFFAQLKFNNNKVKKVIAFLGANSFSVYLIHVQPLIFDIVFVGKFKWLQDFNFIIMAVLVVLCAIGVYLVCIILENIRLFIFKILKINELVKIAASALNKMLNKVLELI